jgi:DNA-nicking Smr family endonuclease
LKNKISDKDKKDWENFIRRKEKLINKDLILNKSINKKIKSIDLHGLTLDIANKKIKEFILENYIQGTNKLIIVTGKGLHSQNTNNPYISKKFGILKNSVPEYINNNLDLMKLISSIEEADIKDGGSGAFYIYLKKNKYENK